MINIYKDIHCLDEIAPNKLNEAKKLMIKALERKFPVEKVFTVQNEGEATNLMRTIGLQKRWVRMKGSTLTGVFLFE